MAAWRSFDLTTRAQDIAEIAMRSIEVLADRMGGAAGPPQRLDLPTTLLPRGSTGHAA